MGSEQDRFSFMVDNSQAAEIARALADVTPEEGRGLEVRSAPGGAQLSFTPESVGVLGGISSPVAVDLQTARAALLVRAWDETNELWNGVRLEGDPRGAQIEGPLNQVSQILLSLANED